MRVKRLQKKYNKLKVQLKRRKTIIKIIKKRVIFIEKQLSNAIIIFNLIKIVKTITIVR